MLDIGWVVRRLVYTFIVVVVFSIATRYVLKSYSLRFAHLVVVNAVSQKAPADYPKSRIHSAFNNCLVRAEKSPTEDQYLQQLLTLSHGLEKVQYLEAAEVDSMLDGLSCD